jgi:hypothetical protein
MKGRHCQRARPMPGEPPRIGPASTCYSKFRAMTNQHVNETFVGCSRIVHKINSDVHVLKWCAMAS